MFKIFSKDTVLFNEANLVKAEKELQKVAYFQKVDVLKYQSPFLDVEVIIHVNKFSTHEMKKSIIRVYDTLHSLGLTRGLITFYFLDKLELSKVSFELRNQTNALLSIDLYDALASRFPSIPSIIVEGQTVTINIVDFNEYPKITAEITRVILNDFSEEITNDFMIKLGLAANFYLVYKFDAVSKMNFDSTIVNSAKFSNLFAYSLDNVVTRANVTIEFLFKGSEEGTKTYISVYGENGKEDIQASQIFKNQLLERFTHLKIVF